MAKRLTRKDFDLIKFPNGEFKLIALKTFTGEIQWKYGAPFNNGEVKLTAAEELVVLMQLDLLVGKLVQGASQWRPVVRNYMTEGYTRQKIYADFLPFKRQDKDKLIGETKFNGIYKIMSNLDFHEVAPHDSDTFAKYALSLYATEAMRYDYVVFPDCGAQERFKNYRPQLLHMSPNMDHEILQEIVVFDKARNADTGSLEFKPFTKKLKGTAVIFDDIIAYGGTFKHVAAELKKAGATKVKLVVNHADGVHKAKELKAAGIDELVILNGGFNE